MRIVWNATAVLYIYFMFDHLFFYLQTKYKRSGENDIPQVYALGIISVLHFFNVLTILILCLFLKLLDSSILSDRLAVLGSLLILLLNYLYFFKIRGVTKIAEQFSSKNANQLKLRNTSIAYIIISIGAFILALGYWVNS